MALKFSNWNVTLISIDVSDLCVPAAAFLKDGARAGRPHTGDYKPVAAQF